MALGFSSILRLPATRIDQVQGFPPTPRNKCQVARTMHLAVPFSQPPGGHRSGGRGWGVELGTPPYPLVSDRTTLQVPLYNIDSVEQIVVGHTTSKAG